jgi:hypothetical protein
VLVIVVFHNWTSFFDSLYSDRLSASSTKNLKNVVYDPTWDVKPVMP